MSNSVVKVSDEALNDSLLLLVGEDGTVMPDKDTVTSYLNSKTGPTNLQVMHINKSDAKGMDVSIDNLTYVPDQNEDKLNKSDTVDQMSHYLYSIRLDHDYTPFTAPKHSHNVSDEDDIVKTLSILDGGSETDMKNTLKTKSKPVKQGEKLQKVAETPKTKQKLSPTASKSKPVRVKAKVEENEDDDDEDDEEYDVQVDEENDNDSDYEIDDQKLKTPKKRSSKRTKSESKTPKSKPKEKVEVKPQEQPSPVQSDSKPTEKKPAKKEKKSPKPIPDDFALFSAPDIIRRVSGSKEPTTPTSESPSSPVKPAKITQERSKSTTDPANTTQQKMNRLSVDSKLVKDKERRTSTDKKRNSVDEKQKNDQMKKLKPTTENPQLNQIEDLGTMITNLSEELNNTPDGQNVDQIGLDLDQTLLDNINNEDLSEDLLYQVAQSLVGNSDLQNAIDKGLQEGVLDPTINVDHNIHQSSQEQNDTTAPAIPEDNNSANKVGTQIVRPDGRVVVIPPIERPATRSRNKKKDDETTPIKPAHKPLDEEHVSGNELDSSNEEEEESEDDPNKLWCICNQPHNNRFMICCDTCEEWYHGKCVNITKLMGQQMEAEGKEWICRFCKDPSLKRPQAAARRIRKASRNSRTSTESVGTPKPEGPAGIVPCVVCQKTARKNSIFCSEACILQHAQGVERVVVFERATGKMLTGSKAPSAANLDDWLKKHPGYEVVRSGGKIVTAKQNLNQSKLKIVKNTDNDGVSLAVQKKGVNVGVLKHSPKQSPQQPLQAKITSYKILNKQSSPKTKLIQPQPLNNQNKPVTILNPGHANKQQVKSPAVTTSPTTPTVKKVPSQTKDKPVPLKTPKSRQQEQAALNPTKHTENIRENVQKTLLEHLTNRLKMCDDLKLTNDEVKSISTDIEAELYKCFGDTGQKYRNKYRSLIFNIKDVKNQTLWRRICEKTINPYELVRLSPDDLASQELALWREREAKHQLDMIKKSELELLNCNRQYVLKTHKGEQVLEDSRPTDNLDNKNEVIKSLTENTPLEAGAAESASKRDSSKDGDKKSSSKHAHRDRDRRRSKEKSGDGKDRRSRERTRKRSRSRERKHSSSDKKRTGSRSRDRHRRSSHHKSSRHKKDQHSSTTSTTAATTNHHISTTDKLDKKSKEILEQLVDNKIVPPLEDRLWKHVPQEDVVAPQAESDSDHEPTSTVTIPTPPRSLDLEDVQNSTTNESTTKTADEERTTTPPPPQTKQEAAEIWRGTINMIDVARIAVMAYDISGDCSGLGKELIANLDIVGRISPDTVWEYISKMKCSNSKEISLLRLAPTNIEEKMPYLALYSYLNTKNRLGVVKSTNKAVKDFYIYPLGAQKPVPPILLPFNGPGLDESRPNMLLGIIVRNKKRRFTETASIATTTPPTKRVKVDVVTAPPRSYTPPPIKDPRLNKLPLPPAVPAAKDDDEEPYSPEDSDPDASPPVLDATSSVFLNTSASSSSYQPTEPYIPGLGSPPSLLSNNTLEIQRQMEELNKEIELQKSEINSISQNIATASTEIGTSALANIALPSNLQQILDSIKTIGAVTTETDSKSVESTPTTDSNQTDLTIPLMIPKSFSRPLSGASDTIPLNLPTKSKLKHQSSTGSPKQFDSEKTNSVLSTLSEEDLIRKAAEMLGETEDSGSKKRTEKPTTPPPPSIKRIKMDVDMRQQMPGSKMEVDLPPVPGLD